jgi:hypothetical protein
MAQVIRKAGRKYVIRFYAKKWKGNAFYREKIDGNPQYTKGVNNAREYSRLSNARVVAGKLTEQTGVVHGLAVRYIK